MIILKRVMTIALAAAIISGCDGQGGGPNKQQAGVGLGAVGGAVLGAQVGKGDGRIVGAAVGALAGALIGGSIGESLDRADRQYYYASQQRALENYKVGQTSTWVNPDSGHSGSFTPTRTFTSNGRYCREFTQVIQVGGQKQNAYGTACRQPDGAWEIAG